MTASRAALPEKRSTKDKSSKLLAAFSAFFRTFVEVMASLVRAAAVRVGRVSAMGMGSIGAGARREAVWRLAAPQHGAARGAVGGENPFCCRSLG